MYDIIIIANPVNLAEKMCVRFAFKIIYFPYILDFVENILSKGGRSTVNSEAIKGAIKLNVH